jgi:acyl-CoA reductase-like NAD-dependent aldehyde dehydrogenase
LSLIAGTRLGPYEILSPLGAGGRWTGEPAAAAAIGRELAAGRVMINEGPLYSDISLPIGGIRDSGLNGSTDKLEEMAYIKRIHLAT